MTEKSFFAGFGGAEKKHGEAVWMSGAIWRCPYSYLKDHNCRFALANRGGTEK